MNLLFLITGIVLFLIGLIVCFVGEKWSKVVLFFIAFIAIFYIVNQFIKIDNQNTKLIICAAIGLIAGILCLFVYNWAPLIIGACAGVFLAMNVDLGIEVIKNNQLYYCLYVIGVAIICALLCHVFKIVMVKIVSGLCGGALIVGSCMYLYNLLFNKCGQNIIDYMQNLYSVVLQGSSVTGVLIATLVVGAFGVLVQFGIVPNPLHKR